MPLEPAERGKVVRSPKSPWAGAPSEGGAPSRPCPPGHARRQGTGALREFRARPVPGGLGSLPAAQVRVHERHQDTGAPDRGPAAEAAVYDDWTHNAHADKIHYNMHDVSNRETKVDTPYQGSPTTVIYTADNLNQYTLVGGVSQVHDDNGDRTGDGTLNFAYDYRSNPFQVAYGAVILSACEFGALGRRTTQTTAHGNFTTVYFYDDESSGPHDYSESTSFAGEHDATARRNGRIRPARADSRYSSAGSWPALR